jgi:hypothetical protein
MNSCPNCGKQSIEPISYIGFATINGKYGKIRTFYNKCLDCESEFFVRTENIGVETTEVDINNVDYKRLKEIQWELNDPYSNKDSKVLGMIIDYLLDKVSEKKFS